MNHNRNILGQESHLVVTRLVGPSRWFSVVGLLKHRLFVTDAISTNRNYFVQHRQRSRIPQKATGLSLNSVSLLFSFSSPNPARSCRYKTF
jgi:hypothetical protein